MGLEKPNLSLDPGESFFPNSVSDLDSAETFQILRNLGLDIDENVCLLDSQPWFWFNCLAHYPHDEQIGFRYPSLIIPFHRTAPLLTLKVAVLKSIFKRSALVSCTGTVIQESSLKNLQIFTCNSEGFIL